MNQAEHKAMAERYMDTYVGILEIMEKNLAENAEADVDFFVDLSIMTTRAAQVHATLATIPDKAPTPLGYM